MQYQIAYFQAAAAHALHDVLRSTDGAGDDMHFHFEPHARHADRFAHVFLPVDDEFLRQDMENLLIHRDVDRARSLNHAIDIELRHFFILDCHHTVRIETLDVRTGDPRQHVFDLHIRHQLGFFQRALNTGDGGFNIDHHAFLQPLRRVLTKPQYFQRTIGRDLSDDRDDL